MFRSQKDHHQVCMLLHVNCYIVDTMIMRYVLNSFFITCSKFKKEKVFWCGASLNVAYLFVDGVCLYISWYVPLSLLRVCVWSMETTY
jgi:hypothetical protein